MTNQEQERDELSACDMLVREKGYKLEGRLASDVVLRTPDGRLIRQANVLEELDRLTRRSQ